MNSILHFLLLSSSVLLSASAVDLEAGFKAPPRGAWRDDLGATHVGPKTLELKDVPLSRLPRFVIG